jgi:HK97 family phage prohead protease
VDHSDDPARVIGRRSAGTLRLTKDDRGLLAEIDTPTTTSGNDVLELVRRGDVTGMSFAFRVMPNGERFERRADGPVRLIFDMTIRSISVVTFPAYEVTNAEVAQRSLREWQQTQSGRSIAWLRLRSEATG